MNLASISIFCLILAAAVLLRETSAGCYQQRLCCRGRNHTCRAKDDGIDHLPTLAPIQHDVRLIAPEVTARPLPRERVGKLILDEHRAAEIYHRYDSADSGGDVDEGKTTSLQLIFGFERVSESVPPENIGYNRKKQPVIRYSLLNKHLPLTISKTHKMAKEDERSPLQYLSEPDPDCYCDEECIMFGDCCSDYTFVCPPSDCQVSAWTAWSSCVLERPGRCGRGAQRRSRTVLQEAFHGGAKCPRLHESMACFVTCRRRSVEQDRTTVALLLDYSRNRTREKCKLRNRPRKLARLKYYCVEYEISWTNPNCVGVDAKKLIPHTTICAECQPEAQLHRKSRRCASDLEDGEVGFWKVIGPKSCTGIWKRVRRTDKCRCARDIPQRSPYLLV